MMGAGQPPLFIPIDPAAEANEMANTYYALSAKADECRLTLPEDADPAVVAALREKANALDDLAHRCTADALGATLRAVQPDLARIKRTTKQAQDQLCRLNDVADAIAILSSAVDLGEAFVTGSPEGVLTAANTLATSLA